MTPSASFIASCPNLLRCALDCPSFAAALARIVRGRLAAGAGEPPLALGLADPVRDAQALTAVVHAALVFKPMVVIHPATRPRRLWWMARPTPCLLELVARLRDFGGLPALLHRLKQALAPLGHRLNVVSASTALGAALLARVHASLHGADIQATGRALARALVWLLGPGRAHCEALQARLGREQVQRLEPVRDHRPERVTACRTADAQMRRCARRGRAARRGGLCERGFRFGAADAAGLVVAAAQVVARARSGRR